MTLEDILERARSLGYLGPGPVDAQIAHAAAFGEVAERHIGIPGRALDLGSGGGVPGLVLAVRWPGSQWFLLESRAGRIAFLRTAASRLDVSDRVTVVHDRAESAGRDRALRASMELVTSRSFGRPAVTAECASPFLAVGGVVLVSEPPDAVNRWPVEGLAELGLVVGERHVQPPGTFQTLIQASLCPERYPRRPNVPRRRPLFNG